MSQRRKHVQYRASTWTVVRHTKIDIDSVSESTIKDIWIVNKDVSLLDGWSGTTRFEFLRTRLLEGDKWVAGSPINVQKWTRAESIWLEAWTQLSKKIQEQKHCRVGESQYPTVSS